MKFVVTKDTFTILAIFKTREQAERFCDTLTSKGYIFIKIVETEVL